VKKQCIGWWIDLFKDMRDANLYDEFYKVLVECLNVCFMHLIQADLDRIAQHWNLYDIATET
jgi:hypothetical protein